MRDLTDKGPQYKAHSSQCFFKKQTKVMCLFYYFILGCTGSLLWCAWLRLSCPEACGLLAPQPGIELMCPACIARWILYHWASREVPQQPVMTGVSSHLDGISPWLDESFCCLILVCVTPHPSFLALPVQPLPFRWTLTGILCLSNVSVCLFSLRG